VCPIVGELISTTVSDISGTTLCWVIQSIPRITSIPAKLMAIRLVGKILLPNPKHTPQIKILEVICPPE
jgi:hypothetical protein